MSKRNPSWQKVSVFCLVRSWRSRPHPAPGGGSKALHHCLQLPDLLPCQGMTPTCPPYGCPSPWSAAAYPHRFFKPWWHESGLLLAVANVWSSLTPNHPFIEWHLWQIICFLCHILTYMYMNLFPGCRAGFWGFGVCWFIVIVIVITIQ